MPRTTLAAVLLFAAAANAQSPIQWNGNARSAIDRAHEQGLPLMFWVTESSDPGDDNDLEDAQNDSFRDPIVVALAQRSFIPVRVSRNSRVLEEAQKLGLPTSHGLYVAIVTSDGKLIDQIDPGQVADPAAFAERLAAASRQYRDEMYQQKLKEKIATPGSPKPEVRRALQTVWRLGILSADTDIVPLLDRTDLLPGEKKRLYDLLGSFATAPCIEALLTRAADGDKDATIALGKAEPGALETLRAEIPAPDTAELTPRQIAACRAAAQISRLPSRDAMKSAPTTPAPATRIERDSMGEMEVPADVLYGASTQRAVLNFPVSGRPVPERIIKAYATLKAAAATVNHRLKRLDADRADAIIEACREIADGLPAFGGLSKNFPIDVYQTGSGTSTNMNVNEVIANIICIRAHKPIGHSKDPGYIKAGGVHPNDHANMGQSSNDTFPTAMHIAAACAIQHELLPSLKAMAAKLAEQSAAWDRIVKIGRTHLQDATPIRLGQEFSGYASQLVHAEERLHRALHTLSELAIGGTAVGTGINTHPEFGPMVAAELTRQTGVHFREASNHFEAQHAKDAVVETSAHLRTLAVSLSKIASDIRLMGMGPRCGLGELILPAVQPGSSIMPGKTNPVIAESLIQVCCQVIGNDAAITTGALGGVGSLLDLNVAMPMMADNLLDSIYLLARGCRVFTENLLEGLKPDEARCKSLIEDSLAMCTSLVPVIGYDKSAALAKQAFKENKTVRRLAEETLVGTKDLAGKTIAKKDLDKYLDPWSMTLPGGEGSAGG